MFCPDNSHNEWTAVLACSVVPVSGLLVFTISSLLMLPLIKYVMSQAFSQYIILLSLIQHTQWIADPNELRALSSRVFQSSKRCCCNFFMTLWPCWLTYPELSPGDHRNRSYFTTEAKKKSYSKTSKVLWLLLSAKKQDKQWPSGCINGAGSGRLSLSGTEDSCQWCSLHRAGPGQALRPLHPGTGLVLLLSSCFAQESSHGTHAIANTCFLAIQIFFEQCQNRQRVGANTIIATDL